jgi:hypothetical protein
VGYTVIYSSTNKVSWVFKSSTVRTCEFQKEIKEEEEKKIVAVINEKSLIMKGDKNKN